MFKQCMIGAALLPFLVSQVYAGSPSAASAPLGVSLYAKQGDSIKVITPIFSQLLMASFPAGFESVVEQQQGPHYIHEMFPKGQNPTNWKQSITIGAIKGLTANPKATPLKFAEVVAGNFQKACPTSFSATQLGGGKVDGFDAFSAIISCGLSPTAAGKNSETHLITVIGGKRDYYTIEWAERGAPSKKPMALDKVKWVTRLKHLTPFRLCPIVPGEAPPYHSCIDMVEKPAAAK